MGKIIPIRKVKSATNAGDTFPADLLKVEGLLGLFLDECLRSAPERRQPVYALAAAICCVGVIAGRRYKSATNLRTNVYCAILGKSSSGKGHSQKVAQQLLHEAGLSQFIASDYQSGNAINTELVEHPARLAIIDEFGIWLSGLTGERTAKHLQDIKKKLMTLFSAAESIVAGSGYANTKERERRDIHEPHLCVLGAGTPDHFFSALQSGALRDGFIPRFLIFKPDDFFPALVTATMPLQISPDMIRMAQEIAGTSPEGGNLAGLLPMRSDASANPALVPFTADGKAEHARYTQRREDIIQGGCVGFHSDELVGKWREHAVKLAMIRAISRDPTNPEMDRVCVDWGWRVAEFCIQTINRMAHRHIADNRVEGENKRVRNLISDAGTDGVTKRDLIQRTRFLDTKQREMILTSLIESGEVAAVPLPSGLRGGRPGFRYTMAA